MRINDEWVNGWGLFLSACDNLDTKHQWNWWLPSLGCTEKWQNGAESSCWRSDKPVVSDLFSWSWSVCFADSESFSLEIPTLACTSVVATLFWLLLTLLIRKLRQVRSYQAFISKSWGLRTYCIEVTQQYSDTVIPPDRAVINLYVKRKD